MMQLKLIALALAILQLLYKYITLIDQAYLEEPHSKLQAQMVPTHIEKQCEDTIQEN